MNLYIKANNNTFEKNGEHRLPWEGRATSFPIYKINKDELKYNIKNGRIAELQLSSKLDPTQEDVFLKIKETITKESKKDIEKLAKDIGHHGLKSPLILNKDGIIIDGNRRFTAISMLLAGEITPFTPQDLLGLDEIDCVILNADSETKSIKTLEYMIQFDDMKKDYNPISRSFSFYDSVVASKIMTVDELSLYTGIQKRSIEVDIRAAELISIFLESIDAEISTAITLKLDGPVKEVATKKERADYYKKHQREWVNLLTLAMNSDDPTRQMRTIIKGYKGKQNIFTSEKVKEEVDKAISIIGVKEVITKAYKTTDETEKAKILKEISEHKKEEAHNILVPINRSSDESKEKNDVGNQIKRFIEFVQDIDVKHINEIDKKRLKNINKIIQGILDEQ